MSLIIFLLLSVVMAVSVGFLASLLLRAWLRKPPAAGQRPEPEDESEPPGSGQ